MDTKDKGGKSDVLSGYAEEADGQDDALSEERILTRVAEYVYSRQDRRKNKE